MLSAYIHIVNNIAKCIKARKQSSLKTVFLYLKVGIGAKIVNPYEKLSHFKSGLPPAREFAHAREKPKFGQTFF